MTIKQALTDNLESNLDAQYASLPMPATALSAAYTWNSTATVTSSDTSEVAVNTFIRLDSDANWFKILSIVPDTSITVEDTYSVGAFPSGATQSSIAAVDPPTPLTGTGNIDTFADAIADAFNTQPIELASFTVAGAPSASIRAGNLIFVSNEVGGAVPAFSDGTDWRRVTDRTIITT